MASKRFANYPQPVDRACDKPGAVPEEDNNPVMKGVSLAIGASLYAFPFPSSLVP